MMRIQPLASGSEGNATLVESGRTRILVDAGLHTDLLEERLRAAEIEPGSIAAVLITHRHRDHVRGVTDFAVRHHSKVIGSRRTLRSVGTQANRRKHTVAPGSCFAVGGLRGSTFALSHDAPETVGFRLRDDHHIYGHATDLGCWDDAVADALRHCHALYIEFNHDPTRLAAFDLYSEQLKQRIAGDLGHLSNRQAESLLRELRWPGLQVVFLAHLSPRTNSPQLATAHAAAALGGHRAEVRVALQGEPTAAAVLAPPPTRCVAPDRSD